MTKSEYEILTYIESHPGSDQYQIIRNIPKSNPDSYVKAQLNLQALIDNGYVETIDNCRSINLFTDNSVYSFHITNLGILSCEEYREVQQQLDSKNSNNIENIRLNKAQLVVAIVAIILTICQLIPGIIRYIVKTFL